MPATACCPTLTPEEKLDYVLAVSLTLGKQLDALISPEIQKRLTVCVGAAYFAKVIDFDEHQRLLAALGTLPQRRPLGDIKEEATDVRGR